MLDERGGCCSSGAGSSSSNIQQHRPQQQQHDLQGPDDQSCPVVRFSRGDSAMARIDPIKTPDSTLNGQTLCSEMLLLPAFGPFSVICLAFSIVTYALDLVLVAGLLYLFVQHEHMLYFFVTLVLALIPAILMSAISMRWYIVDHDDPSIVKPSLVIWVVRIVFLLLHVAPLLRYLDTLIYGVRYNIARATGPDHQIQQLGRRMLDEDTNGSLLRLFHCFLHAAPQAIIQLMLLLRHLIASDRLVDLGHDVAIVQALLVIAALLSIGWTLTCYHRSVRYARDDKIKISWVGTLAAFCWHLCSAVGRVVALALLAAVYPVWMGTMCAVHWGVMAGWLALGQHQTAACGSRCEELLLSAALGLAYILSFLAPRDGPTRYVYLAYYLVCLMENTGALVVWCVVNNSVENPWLYYGAPGTQVIAFLLGLVFLYIYYAVCHPSTSHGASYKCSLDRSGTTVPSATTPTVAPGGTYSVSYYRNNSNNGTATVLLTGTTNSTAAAAGVGIDSKRKTPRNST